MMRYGIAQFVGSWVSASGYRLRIKKVRKDQASVDFLDPRGAAHSALLHEGAPSVNMVARYDDYHETFEVDLWEEGKEFMLDLTHEYNYELDLERREALVPALTRYERDRFLDEYYSLFGRWITLCEEGRRTKQPPRRAVGQLRKTEHNQWGTLLLMNAYRVDLREPRFVASQLRTSPRTPQIRSGILAGFVGDIPK